MDLDTEDLSLLVIAINTQVKRLENHLNAIRKVPENYSEDFEFVYEDHINRLKRLRFRISAERTNIRETKNSVSHA